MRHKRRRKLRHKRKQQRRRERREEQIAFAVMARNERESVMHDIAQRMPELDRRLEFIFDGLFARD